MDLERIDWQAVERLRRGFLDGTAGRADYWLGPGDLATYDQTFGQRIGWKWDWVLGELVRRDWSPPDGAALDWGCGSGIAARAFVRRFGVGSASGVILWDRSRLAMEFAAAKVAEEHPAVQVRQADTGDATSATLLVSHVLGELADRQADELVAQAATATAVIWVEPGTFETSRALIAVRERLRDRFQVVAPCTHRSACGMLAPGNERHWCHHFAASPPEVFTDGQWARFGRAAGIDLRSLPLSFLVLDRRAAPPLPPGAVRVIGRPRVEKARALLFGCDGSGVRDRRLLKRRLPDEFRALRRGDMDSLQVWRCDGDQIVALRELPPHIRS